MEVVSFFRRAVPRLTNSSNIPRVLGAEVLLTGEIRRLNLYSLLRQPAKTRLGRFVTST